MVEGRFLDEGLLEALGVYDPYDFVKVVFWAEAAIKYIPTCSNVVPFSVRQYYITNPQAESVRGPKE